MSSLVILVHGLWVGSFELMMLRRRLRAADLQTALFSYPSTTRSMKDHAQRLIDFARAQQADRLHFVGHSLGGIVILRALQISEALPPGRVVLLGPPLQGSRAVNGLAKSPLGRAILGKTIQEECLGCSSRAWTGQREVGIIAGSSRRGLGQLFADFDEEHDGTVMVSETRLPGAKDHLVVPTSHTGMVFASEVASQTLHFLAHGRFRR